MANTERFSVSVDKDRAARLRALVERGTLPSMSSAFDAAADAIIELEDCDEAEQHPEKLLDADTFFRDVRDEIARAKKIAPRS